MTQCKCGIGKPHGEDGLPYDVALPYWDDHESETIPNKTGGVDNSMPIIILEEPSEPR